LTLGSHPSNDVVIDAPSVSRFHARLDLDPHGYLLTDLDSTNGTSVEGLRVRSAYLPASARIKMGRVQLTFEVDAAREELPVWAAERFGAVLGQSPVMRRLFARLEQLAPSEGTVLLQGETGTGKDLIAEEIHRHSARRDGPFVVVDCGGLPSTLIEAEL